MGMLKDGSCATQHGEPCQVLTEAAVSGMPRVPQASLSRVTRPDPSCKLHFEARCMTFFIGEIILDKQVLGFLRALGKNNSLEWMHSLKEIYLDAKKMFIDLSGQLIASISGLEPWSIFRLNRDTRFSKDKTPYNTSFRSYISNGSRSPFPAGYGMGHPLAEYFKHKSWDIEYRLSNERLESDGSVEFISEKFRPMKPLNDYFNDALKTFAFPQRG